jgi:group I intron endonuclease
MAYIYEISNDITDKKYIGKTEDSIEKRFSEHCREAFQKRSWNRPLYRAMRKYGLEHFSIKLLEETAEPEIREIYWIEQKNSYFDGYNATLGGDGKKYLNYTQIIELYATLKNQKAVAEALGITPDTVRKVLKSANISRIKNPVQRKAVVQKTILGETCQTFDSCSNAARYLINNGYTTAKLNTVTNKITECANGKRKSGYGFSWQFI